MSITRYAKKQWLDQQALKKKPEVWMRTRGPMVLDPDGWRFRHGTNLEPKDWDEPITYEEFRERARHSTTTLRSPHERRAG